LSDRTYFCELVFHAGVFKHLDISNRYQFERALLPLPAF